MSPSKPTTGKEKIIIIVSVILALPVLFYLGVLVLFVNAWTSAQDEYEKERPKEAAAIRAEVARYTFSPACTHTSEDAEGADTQHTYEYHALYTCAPTNWGTLHDEIVGDLTHLGYVPEDDIIVRPRADGKYFTTNVISDLSYISSCCRTEVSPVFNVADGPAQSLAEFRSEPVTNYSVTVKKYR